MTRQIDRASITATAWKAFRYFNLYRLVISGLFVVLVWTTNLPPPIGSFEIGLFAWTAVAYFTLAILAQFFIETRLPRFRLQVLAVVVLDVATITLMMYASGGVTSGFGMLLIVAIAGGSLFTGGRTALMFAAIASLAVLGEELYLRAYLVSVVNYTHAGLLGAAFFATAFLGHVLVERIRESEALAAQRALDIANLSALNEHIVQRMQSGIVVLDRNGRVRLMNAAARRLMGLGAVQQDQPLASVSARLTQQHTRWLEHGHNTVDPIVAQQGALEILASFTGLGPDAKEGTLVFLEDAAITRQRAQQMKLASLGRLTASIAHEIRNPLGAISHASQLLHESPAANEEDQRLTSIIRDHSGRVNRIIENVLQIGRRDDAIPESFSIQPWLDNFVAELQARKNLRSEDVRLSMSGKDVRVRMDGGQLHQILWNLCENALRYSRERPLLELAGGMSEETERPYLDVRDSGPGMEKDVVDQVFEPFFTTDPNGTGLGLYLAGELCESNQASLSLRENSQHGCTFRISFAHPDRQQLTAS